jgi:hypothetical protein
MDASGKIELAELHGRPVHQAEPDWRLSEFIRLEMKEDFDCGRKFPGLEHINESFTVDLHRFGLRVYLSHFNPLHERAIQPKADFVIRRTCWKKLNVQVDWRLIPLEPVVFYD